eukprot:UN04478
MISCSSTIVIKITWGNHVSVVSLFSYFNCPEYLRLIHSISEDLDCIHIILQHPHHYVHNYHDTVNGYTFHAFHLLLLIHLQPHTLLFDLFYSK